MIKFLCLLLKFNKMVEASKMEVDLEDTTHESNAKTPMQIKPDAPTVLIAIGMAGSGKTTFVHVSQFDYIQTPSLKASDKLPSGKWQKHLQHKLGSSSIGSEFSM